MALVRLLMRHVGDGLVLAVLAGQLAWLAFGVDEAHAAVTVPFALLTTLPLLARRRFPFLAPTVVIASFAVEAVLVGDTEAFVDGIHWLVFVFGVPWFYGALNELRPGLAGYVLTVGVGAVLLNYDPEAAWEDMVFVAVVTGAAFLAGVTMGQPSRRAAELTERAARLERDREEEALAAVAEERSRIARELHDVIAHSISVMTVQAGAARMLLDEDPGRALEPVTAVEETGRQALAELRRLLGVLRKDMAEPELAPQPGLDELDALLERARAAGLDVALEVEGEPTELGPGIDLAAYRVVQEALTNALEHAGPTQARVRLRYGRDELELEIANEAGAGGNGAGSGLGLVGLRERVALYGGELEAGRRRGGGYRVRARLPLAAAG